MVFKHELKHLILGRVVPFPLLAAVCFLTVVVFLAALAGARPPGAILQAGDLTLEIDSTGVITGLHEGSAGDGADRFDAARRAEIRDWHSATQARVFDWPARLALQVPDARFRLHKAQQDRGIGQTWLLVHRPPAGTAGGPAATPAPWLRSCWGFR